MKLKSKLMSGMLVVALVPLLVSMSVLHNENITNTKLLATNKAKQTLQSMAENLSDYFTLRISEIKTYARTPVIRSMSPKKFSPFIKKEIVYHNEHFEKFIVGRPDGRYYYTSGGNPYLGGVASFNDGIPAARAKSIAKRDYWLYTLGENQDHTEKSYVSNPMISYTTGAKQIVVAASILDKNDNVVGMLGGSLPWDKIERRINKLRKDIEKSLPWDVRLFLISPKGIYWYHWDSNKVVHIQTDSKGEPVLNEIGEKTSIRKKITDEANPELAEIGRRMINGEEGYSIVTDSKTNEEVAIFYMPIESAGYSVGMQVPYEQINVPVASQIRMQILLTLGAIILVVIVVINLSKKIARPISSLRDAADEVAKGQWDYPLPIGGDDEVSDLTKSFSTMTASIKEREDSLADSEEQFVLAMKGANDGLWDWNTLTNEVYFSPRWKSILGYGVNEFEESFDNFAAHLHPEDAPHVEEQIGAYLSEQIDKFEIELRMRHKEGHYIDILSRGFAVHRETDNVPIRFVGTHTEITERKRMERALVESRNYAEEANQAKSQFLSSMSHELRTPLNAILGFAQLLEMNAKDELSKDNSQEIIYAGKHLLQLINQVLDLSKIDSGTIDVSIKSHDFNKVFNDTLSLIKPIAEKHAIQICNNVSPSSDIYINVDDLRFKQVLLNILSNAIKYNSENGKVTIDCSTNDEKMLCLSVTDTGKGLTAEQQKNMFLPFNRAEKENSNIEGTGLGLTISKQLIEQMDGKITIESEIGKGSCFIVQVPLS